MRKKNYCVRKRKFFLASVRHIRLCVEQYSSIYYTSSNLYINRKKSKFKKFFILVFLRTYNQQSSRVGSVLKKYGHRINVIFENAFRFSSQNYHNSYHFILSSEQLVERTLLAALKIYLNAPQSVLQVTCSFQRITRTSAFVCTSSES